MSVADWPLVRPDLAIDLGTVSTLVHTARQGIVMDEPSVVALRRGCRKLLAVGAAADALDGRAPEDVEVVRPLRDGVVSDLEASALLLEGLLRRVGGHHWARRPNVLICVPAGATTVERRALVETASAGCRSSRVTLVDEGVAAAIGSGPAECRRAVLVVDVGGGTAELAIVNGAARVRSRSVRAAGNAMDQAVIQAVRAHSGLVVGERTAERLKMAVGLVAAGPALPVAGVDPKHGGWPLAAEIPPELVAGAIGRAVRPILRALAELLGEVPPDLAGEILDGGVRLSGGGALLPGLRDLIATRTGYQVEVVPDPRRAVVRGMARLLQRASSRATTTTVDETGPPVAITAEPGDRAA